MTDPAGNQPQRARHLVAVRPWASVIALAVTVQFALGETDQRALHIFLGVLVVMLGTALTSWTYRHEMPSRR